MNKAQLIDEIAKITNLPKAVVHKILDALLEVIPKSLAAGDVVSLVNFGTFSVKDRKEKIGRNPRTGVEIIIKATKIPVFKAGKALKEAVCELEETAQA